MKENRYKRAYLAHRQRRDKYTAGRKVGMIISSGWMVGSHLLLMESSPCEWEDPCCRCLLGAMKRTKWMKEEIESQKKKKFVKNENEKRRLKRMRRRKGFQTLYKYRPEGCASAEEVKTMRTHGDSERTHILKMRTHDLTRLDHAYAW